MFNPSPIPDPEKLDVLPGLDVHIDKVVYLADANTSPEQPHAFAYYITITNHSPEKVTIKGRKWVIQSDQQEIQVVEGDGVVGQFPTLDTGEHFSYNSYHVGSAHRSWMEGAYFAVTSEGRKVITRIPRFELVVPEDAGLK